MIFCFLQKLDLQFSEIIYENLKCTTKNEHIPEENQDAHLPKQANHSSSPFPLLPKMIFISTEQKDILSNVFVKKKYFLHKKQEMNSSGNITERGCSFYVPTKRAKQNAHTPFQTYFLFHRTDDKHFCVKRENLLCLVWSQW